MLRPEPRHASAFAADDDRGPVKLRQHARRHDAYDADVPEQPALDDHKIVLRVELRAHHADDFVD